MFEIKYERYFYDIIGFKTRLCLHLCLRLVNVTILPLICIFNYFMK